MLGAIKFICGSPFQQARLPTKTELEQLFPVAEIQWDKISNPDPTCVQTTWIGHASFLVQMGGANILTDPVFCQRASPVGFAGPWRYAKLPFTVKELPHIDCVVISHSHYDHLDLDSVKEIAKERDPTFYVGLGLAKWFKAEGINNVVEMDWWESNHITNFKDVKVECIPVQHWSARTAFDRNKTLWCGWVVKYAFPTCDPLDQQLTKECPSDAYLMFLNRSKHTTFCFVGDTAYCEVFKVVGRLHGPITAAVIPIGAYLPRKFMKGHHASPEDAVCCPFVTNLLH